MDANQPSTEVPFPRRITPTLGAAGPSGTGVLRMVGLLASGLAVVPAWAGKGLADTLGGGEEGTASGVGMAVVVVPAADGTTTRPPYGTSNTSPTRQTAWLATAPLAGSVQCSTGFVSPPASVALTPVSKVCPDPFSYLRPHGRLLTGLYF